MFYWAQSLLLGQVVDPLVEERFEGNRVVADEGGDGISFDLADGTLVGGRHSLEAFVGHGFHALEKGLVGSDEQSVG